MTLRGKLRTGRALSWADRRAIAEAVVTLAVARAAVRFLPFRWIAPWCQRVPESSACDQALLRRVRFAVTIAAKNVPWNAVCLPQALAAKVMLARRGCGSALHLGAGLDDDGQLHAHAWLVAGGHIVVGGAGVPTVTPIARFG